MVSCVYGNACTHKCCDKVINLHMKRMWHHLSFQRKFSSHLTMHDNISRKVISFHFTIYAATICWYQSSHVKHIFPKTIFRRRQRIQLDCQSVKNCPLYTAEIKINAGKKIQIETDDWNSPVGKMPIGSYTEMFPPYQTHQQNTLYNDVERERETKNSSHISCHTPTKSG